MDHHFKIEEILEEEEKDMKKVAPGQKYIQGKKLLEMDQKSWVEVTLDYEPTEEDLNPGENVTLHGLLVVEEMLLDKDPRSHIPPELCTNMSLPPVQCVSHKLSNQPHEDLHAPPQNWCHSTSFGPSGNR